MVDLRIPSLQTRTSTARRLHVAPAELGPSCEGRRPNVAVRCCRQRLAEVTRGRRLLARLLARLGFDRVSLRAGLGLLVTGGAFVLAANTFRPRPDDALVYWLFYWSVLAAAVVVALDGLWTIILWLWARVRYAWERRSRVRFQSPVYLARAETSQSVTSQSVTSPRMAGPPRRHLQRRLQPRLIRPVVIKRSVSRHSGPSVI